MLRKHLPHIILILGSLSIAIAVAEILARHYYPESEHDNLFCRDEHFGWQFCNDVIRRVIHRDYDHYISTDGNGQRDFGAIDSDKENIIVIGDSFTSNIGVESPADVFTEILERRLDNRFNVLNLGVNGYGTAQEYLKMKKALEKHQARIVLLMFYIRNDFYDNIGLLDWIKGYKRPLFVRDDDGENLTIEEFSSDRLPPEKNQSDIRAFLSWSRLYGLFKRATTRALSRVNLSLWTQNNTEAKDPGRQSYLRETPTEIVLASQDPEIQYAFDITCDILDFINRELASKEIEFYVFMVPSIFQVRDDFFEEIEILGISRADRFRANDVLRSCAEARKIQIVDLTPSLVDIENKYRRPYLYYPREIHWNIAGNKAVAKVIHDTLINTSGLFEER